MRAHVLIDADDAARVDLRRAIDALAGYDSSRPWSVRRFRRKYGSTITLVNHLRSNQHAYFTATVGMYAYVKPWDGDDRLSYDHVCMLLSERFC